MSKSKKNTIDPEIMINQYGADAVRWFILSDSPPEKDVQWSDTGVPSANKFLQKIWNLNFLICNRKETKADKNKESKFTTRVDVYLNKIDASINEFRFNVAIANFYEVYKFFKDQISLEINNKLLRENIIKIMKLMIPFTPHLAYECLELLNCNTVHIWPKIGKNIVDEIKLAIQINGKTRDIITVSENLMENEINHIVLNESKAKKFLEGKKINKTIFVKNKIINYIL